MNQWGTEGLILKRTNFGEADRIVTIFTKRKGKITAIAKGVRRINSRRAPNLEVLNQSKLFFAETKSLPILTEAETISTFENLKSDLTKLTLTYQILEIVDRLFEDRQEQRSFYDELIEVLNRMNSSELVELKNLLFGFQIKVLERTGFRPQLFTCVRCGKILTEQSHRLAPALGGLLGGCCSSEFASRHVSVETIKVLRFLQKESFDDVERLRLPTIIERETGQALSDYLEFVLEASLASTKLAQRLESL